MAAILDGVRINMIHFWMGTTLAYSFWAWSQKAE